MKLETIDDVLKLNTLAGIQDKAKADPHGKTMELLVNRLTQCGIKGKVIKIVNGGTDIPDNQIWYTTFDGQPYDMQGVFDYYESQGDTIAYHIVSNEKVGNKYVITFDAPILYIGYDESDAGIIDFPCFVYIGKNSGGLMPFPGDGGGGVVVNPTPGGGDVIGLPGFSGGKEIGDGGGSSYPSLPGLEDPTNPGLVIGDDNYGDDNYGDDENVNIPCNVLTVILPNSVRAIFGGFYGPSIESITIPNSVEFISEYSIVSDNLEIINYTGTIAEWNNIEKQEYWYNGGEPDVIHCTDGDIEPPGSNKTYLYLDDGEVIILKGSLNPNGSGNTSKVYQYRYSLVSAVIDEGMDFLDDYSFRDCSNLTSISLPNSITGVGYQVFANCNSLPVEGGLRYADTYLVSCVETLPEYTVKDGTRWIGNSMFYYNYTMTAVNLPSSIETIFNNAFSESGLSSIVIPDGVKEIKSNAFVCSNLTSVNLPNSVTVLGNNLFEDYYTTSKISEPIYNSKFFAFCPNNMSGEYTVPEGIEVVVGHAFYRCHNITSLILPSTVKELRYEAVGWNYGLLNVEIPESITLIGDYAFRDCSSITAITCKADTPPSIESHTFYNTNNCPIYVPAFAIDDYKAATNWSNYASRIQGMQKQF